MANPPARFFEGDLVQLRSFYYAALFRSFTRAAEQLSMGQPSVSNHIRLLEQVLGVPLFDRHPRGATLTDAGRALFDRAAPLVEGIDRLPGELQEHARSTAEGEVSLAAGQELLLHVAGPVLRTFRQRHPTVRLLVLSGVRGQVHELVAADAVQFGLAGRAGLPALVDFEEVLSDQLVLVAPRDHTLAKQREAGLAEVARHPVLLPDRASSTRRLVEQAFAQRGLELQISMELERWHVIKEFVALGLGVAIVPSFSVAGDDARVAVRPLAHAFPPSSYGLITRRGRYLPPIARELAASIRAGVAGSRGRRA